MINALMYSAHFEALMHSEQNQPVGKIFGLSDPDIFPAKNHQDAIEKAHERAKMIEHLKSLRLSNKHHGRKLRVRVQKVSLLKHHGHEVIFTQKRKSKQFK